MSFDSGIEQNAIKLFGVQGFQLQIVVFSEKP